METFRSTKSRKPPKDRARKREQDRKAQRSAREKNKALIAQLQSRVDTLTRFHDTGSTKVLIDELEHQRKSNESLRATLRSLQGLIASSLSDNGHAVDAYSHRSRQSPACEAESSVDEEGSGPSRSSRELSLNMEQPDDRKYDSPTTTRDTDQNVAQEKIPCQDLNPPFNPSHTGLPQFDQFGQWQDVQGRLFMYLNELIERCSTIGPRVTPDQTTRDADIPIRAIIEGWDAVSRRYALDPVWGMLRAADESIWRKLCGEAERLAILRVVSAMFRVGITTLCDYWLISIVQYRSDPSEANLQVLPRFMRHRPSQLRIVHKPLVDFVVWPGLRERLVLFPDQHCSDNFCALFWSCFRFNWPHQAREAFVSQAQPELYAFPESFNESFYDLQSWRMTPRFFHAFPDIKADVPIALASAGTRGSLSTKDSDMPVGRVGPGDSVAVKFPSMDWQMDRMESICPWGLGGGPANRPGVSGGAQPPRLHLFDSEACSAWTFHHHLSRPRQTSVRAKPFALTACRHRMYSTQPTEPTRSWRKSKSSEEARPSPVISDGRGTMPDRVKRLAEIKRTGGRIGSRSGQPEVIGEDGVSHDRSVSWVESSTLSQLQQKILRCLRGVFRLATIRRRFLGSRTSPVQISHHSGQDESFLRMVRPP
ncbi:hypothetical protein BDW42DRAFT_182658 [Aspergillus taichungensis]|uniref:BZIP domain-containing protein n=1 Tax=Aspergillus taichungensis TaxID=482145 RepID=A0A2J5I801_9EURO|nr:hypothetical protein BDW42DRAFT_182658 [Aspergillus taichungensis]